MHSGKRHSVLNLPPSLSSHRAPGHLCKFFSLQFPLLQNTCGIVLCFCRVMVGTGKSNYTVLPWGKLKNKELLL